MTMSVQEGTFGGVGTATERDVVFDHTVPRRLVHRAAVSEVLLTDVRMAAENVFHVGAQWPRDHGFYRMRTDEHDPMLLAETIRQAGLAIAHRAFDVPYDRHFMTHTQSYRIRPDGLRIDSRPAEILLVVTCHEVKRSRLGLRGMKMEIVCYRDQERIGSGHVAWSCVAAATYGRLRGAQYGMAAVAPTALPVPVSPRSVGRQRDRDVTIGATTTPGTWPVRVVSEHAVLFDHPVDHVPGMLLLEAARQSALLVVEDADAVPIGLSVSFLHFVEHDGPTTVSAHERPAMHPGERLVGFSVDQDGRQAVHGTIILTGQAGTRGRR